MNVSLSKQKEKEKENEINCQDHDDGEIYIIQF